MNSNLLGIFRAHPIVHHYLHDYSYEYKRLYRDFSYWKVLEEKAKETYGLRMIDRLGDLEGKVHLLRTFLDVMK